VRAVQVHVPASFGRRDVYLGHSAVSFDDLGDAWQFERPIQLWNCIFHAFTPHAGVDPDYNFGLAPSHTRANSTTTERGPAR